MKISLKFLAAVLIFSISCTPQDTPPAQTEDPEETVSIPLERTFMAKGADISWVTQMESEGMKFYNSNGQERECTALMKEIGMNSIRLRVWVNPADGWCGKDDVVIKARRAQALGMKIMIDFHYSDTWADPSRQKTPSAWSGYNAAELAEAVSAHTEDVLGALKEEGVDVTWVQVGNEVNSGMLHPLGNINTESNIYNFVKFVNAGYDAVKKVYPEAAVILHRSNGHETDKFGWFLDTMTFQKAKFDMIGMSLYPTWWDGSGFVPWKTNSDLCIRNIKAFADKYDKPVMICETGMPVNEPQMSKAAMQYILDEIQKIKECHGVFYWEPQAPNGYNSGYDKGAFADGKPTIALDPFKE